MTDECIIQADYTNWRPIPSRKVLELRFEVDISLQSEVLAYLGAPATDKSIPCAIALLDLKLGQAGKLTALPTPPKGEVNGLDSAPTSQAEGGPHKKWNEYARSQQAAILCQDEDFRRYFGGSSEVTTAMNLKGHFNIESRRELDDPANWERWDEFVALWNLHRQRHGRPLRGAQK